MARTIKEWQSIYIPFIDGESVSDSQNRPRMYKSVEQFERSYPGLRLKEPKLVEYAPVVHGKWIGTFPILGAGDFEFRCSKCWCVRHEENATYCPNCGAKMDLEQ